ncbi:MAG: hypothetical protein ACFFDH_19675 [Promethearchaeota archaeon]
MEEPQKPEEYIPFRKLDEEKVESRILKTAVDLIKKKRELNWRQSLSYYCLHPEKFKFGFKDLK